jgi:hypothetical protein
MKSWFFAVMLILVLVTHVDGRQTSEGNDSLQQHREEWAGDDDTTSVQPITFDQATLKRLAEDPELNYKQPPTVAQSLFTRFLIWAGQLITDLIKALLPQQWVICSYILPLA